MKIINIDELLKELDKHNFKELHLHQTWKPTFKSFTGNNHLNLQEGMQRYHINVNGWSDIAQHLTLFPDGEFMTGRPFNIQPASIKGWNGSKHKPLMVEMIGNFDIKGTGSFNKFGYDVLEGIQKQNILKLIKYFINRYGESSIKFHREGPGVTKTCPGTSLNKFKLIAEAKGEKVYMLIKYGSKGNAVKELQSNLNSLGFNIGVTDGIAGDNTVEGIKAFQRANRLTDDGFFGTNSYDVLNELLKPDSTDHWAQKHYDSLKKQGLNISQTRFDDNITRGEVFSLLDDLVKKKMI